MRWCDRRFPFVTCNLDLLKTKLGTGTPLAIAIARLTPGLLLPATVASGAMAVGYVHFVLGILISSLIADLILIASGVAMGLGVKFLGIEPSPWVFVVGLVIVIALVWFLPRRFLKRRESGPGR